MRDKEIREGLGELADVAERDHEVQMARAELYKLAKYAIKLHDMIKGVSEAEGLEGWVQSKITKSADMIGSVYHHMDYDESPMSDESLVVDEGKSPHKKGSKKYKKHMAAMHAESLQDRLAAKLAESNSTCKECGNPSYKSVSEEKKKGSHGKVCWKGYRRGKGNSCHKVKGDG